VIKVTPSSLGYPLSVFNTTSNFPLKKTRMLGKTFSRQDEECCQRYFPAKMMLFRAKLKMSTESLEKQGRSWPWENGEMWIVDVRQALRLWLQVCCITILYLLACSFLAHLRKSQHAQSYTYANTLTRVCKCVHICVSSYRQPESGCQS